MQVEYSTDLMFRSEAILEPLYEQLSRQAVLAVKAEQVAASSARRSPRSWPRRSAAALPPASRAPASSTASARAGVKMYDKFGRVLRLETTTNDVSFFKHHRKVEHEDGTTTRNWRRSRRRSTA